MDENLRSELIRTLTRNPKLAPILADALAAYLDSLPAGEAVALYGCGAFAAALTARRPDSLRRLDARFVVTNPAGQTDYHGWPVVPVAGLADAPPAKVVLLSATFAHEMRAHLGFMPSDAIVSLEQVVEAAGLENLLDRVRQAIAAHVAAEAARMERELPPGRPRLFFFTPQPPQHMVKTMRVAVGLGYAVAVVVERTALTPSISLAHYAGKDVFHSLYEVGFVASLELLELERALGPALVHAEAGMWSAEPLAYVMERLRTPVALEYRDFLPVVFASDADAMATLRLTPADYAREMDAQGRIYALADGVIMKDAPETLDFLEDRFGVRQEEILHFYHYFSQGMAAPGPVEKLSAATGETHLVYAGGVVNNPDWHNYPIYSSLLTAARVLADQRIHLTVYNAGDSTGQGYEEYLRLDEECPYFHYAFAVPYDELKNVLPRHDFGWFCFDFSHARENPVFLRTTMGSKVFTYLEAGLPVLVSPEQTFITRVITEWLGTGLAVSFDALPGLSGILAGVDRGKLAANIEQARREWTYERHAPRLGAFYERLARQGRRTRP
jgi:hypothetical protein